MSLDVKTIEKIAVHIDYANYIHNDDDDVNKKKKKKNKTKNPNVTSRFKDLKYTTNAQSVYDLDEDIGELLELFNSYKTETVYEVNVFDEDGELETMSFDSEEDYKNYIRSDCAENQLDYMVENFLKKRDKKVYFDPLFDLIL